MALGRVWVAAVTMDPAVARVWAVTSDRAVARAGDAAGYKRFGYVEAVRGMVVVPDAGLSDASDASFVMLGVLSWCDVRERR